MKLIRFGDVGSERPGLLLSGGRSVDASGFGEDYNEHFFETDGLERLKRWADQHAESAPGIDPALRVGAPIARPGKIICIGLNFKDHAEETGAELPREPILFFKASSAFCGPNDNLIIPRASHKTDWEVELAVVIKKRASYVAEKEAMDYVAGYALHNDYSERSFQLERSGQWVKGKSCDSFAPLGPVLATPEEVEDVNNLNMWLKVNGEIRQDSNSCQLYFKIPFLIHYISQFMTLLPGDVISTGTPPGVGMGHTPQLFLKPGDEIELGIEGLGIQKQTAVGA